MRRFLTLSFRVGGEIGVKSLFIPAAEVLIILGGLFGKACELVLFLRPSATSRLIFFVCYLFVVL